MLVSVDRKQLRKLGLKTMILHEETQKNSTMHMYMYMLYRLEEQGTVVFRQVEDKLELYNLHRFLLQPINKMLDYNCQ